MSKTDELPIVAKLLAFVNNEPLTKPPYDSIREAAATMQELCEELEAALDEREQEHGSLPDGAPHWSARARRVLSKTRGEA